MGKKMVEGKWTHNTSDSLKPVTPRVEVAKVCLTQFKIILPDFQPELGGCMGSILWTPSILTSNNRWILIYMNSFQFAFQQYVNTIFYGLLPVNNFPSELLPARTFRPSVPLSYLRTRCVLSFSSSLDHQDITCNRRAGTGSVLSLWKLLGWGWSTPYQFRHLVCRSSREKIFSFQGLR